MSYRGYLCGEYYALFSGILSKLVAQLFEILGQFVCRSECAWFYKLLLCKVWNHQEQPGFLDFDSTTLPCVRRPSCVLKQAISLLPEILTSAVEKKLEGR